MRRYPLLPLILCAALVAMTPNFGLAQQTTGPVVSTAAQANDAVQEDFPAMCLDKDGTAWVANNVPYITKLNGGSSKQAPSGFVQIAIARAVQAIR